MRSFSIALLLLGTALLGGCTETIYREVPQGTQATPTGTANGATGDTPTVPSNMTEGSPTSPIAGGGSSQGDGTTVPVAGAGTDPVTSPGTNPIFADGSSPIVSSLLDAPEGTVTGTAGAIVDCQLKLPCRWVSADTQFAVTVTNADNIATRERLSVNFSVSVLHDTQIIVGSVDAALDSAGRSNQAADMMLGEGNGNVPTNLMAGSTVAGTINYTSSASSNQLSSFVISLMDNGLPRQASLINLPIGTVTTDYADCNFILPCVWASPDGQVTITLLSAGGYASNGRLNANFQVRGTRDMMVALDAGAAAIDSNGIRYNGRTHLLGRLSGYDKLTAEAIAGIGISGAVDFFRSDSSPVSLARLSMVIYEDSPVQRWNPQFQSVPIQ